MKQRNIKFYWSLVYQNEADVESKSHYLRKYMSNA